MDRRDFIKTSICAVAVTALGVELSNPSNPNDNIKYKYPDIIGIMQKHTQIQLFELNDNITRKIWSEGVAQDIRSLGYDDGSFMIICDETNNTPELIDKNGFFGSVLMHDDGEYRRLDIGVKADGMFSSHSTPVGVSLEA